MNKVIRFLVHFQIFCYWPFGGKNVKLMEQQLDTRYGHIIISYEKKMVKSELFFFENFIFLMFSLFVQHFCFLDQAANSLIRHRTLIPCLGGTKCLSKHPCL